MVRIFWENADCLSSSFFLLPCHPKSVQQAKDSPNKILFHQYSSRKVHGPLQINILFVEICRIPCQQQLVPQFASVSVSVSAAAAVVHSPKDKKALDFPPLSLSSITFYGRLCRLPFSKKVRISLP